jgi:hypothetical protein
MSRKTITLLGWIIIPIGVFFSCISSYWITLFLFSSKLTFWKSLDTPSSGVAIIVEADRNDVWIKTNSGELFTLALRCPNDEICKQWLMVESVDETHIEKFTTLKRGKDCEKLDTDELPKNPNSDVAECVLAIFPGPEYDFKTYYAIMTDGSIKYWRYQSSYWDLPFFVVLFFSFSLFIIYSYSKFRNRYILQENAG